MFVYSVKSNTLKFIAVIAVAVIAFVAVIVALPESGSVYAASIFEGDGTVRFDKVKNEKDRVNFLKQFGWEAEDGAIEEVEIKVPNDFDKIMNAYNEIQKSQGLDLAAYKGKTVTRYTYKILNYPDYDGDVFANIIICDNNVIAGDICSADTEGFIQGFEMIKHK